METLLVTGSAGFIGFHVTRRLIRDGYEVVGLDNLNAYYDLELKHARLEQLRETGSFEFEEIDLAASEEISSLFQSASFDAVVHLAAQAGVRYSIDQPRTYTESNVSGFLNVLEGCRHGEVDHLVYASSSSVYGKNRSMPYDEHDSTEHPVSLYAATKKSNEMMAHAYAELYNLPTTGLRFFTVYGPWGRPDMALFLFTEAIVNDEPIDVFNRGDMYRDFTYVNDVVEGVVRVMREPAAPDPDWSPTDPDPARSDVPYRIFNIGNGEPVHLMSFIETLEEVIGKTAEKDFLPMQPGDVQTTHAEVSELKEAVGYEPDTSIREGIERFVRWYGSYYGVEQAIPGIDFE